MPDSARAILAQTRRLVVKLGTNVIMRADGLPALSRLYGILESVATLGHDGLQAMPQRTFGRRVDPQRAAQPDHQRGVCHEDQFLT